MSKGILYIMTTSVEGLIKIGKTQNFNNRMVTLEQNGYWNVSGLKRFFAVKVDDYDEKEKLIHTVFSKSQVSSSELFALDKNIAKDMLEAFEGEQIYPEVENEFKINDKDVHMISRATNKYSFKGCNIPIGTELTFRKNDNIKVITADDNNLVKYNGTIMNISKAAWYCFNKKDTWKYNGFVDFKYKDKKLIDIYNENTAKINNISKETISNEKEILINTLFTGKYTEDSNNIAHEITNVIKDDNSNINLFITHGGKIGNHNIDKILFVKNNDRPYIVEIVAMADKLTEYKNDIITYNGKEGNEIFHDGISIMYQTKDVQIPKNMLYIGVKGLVKDNDVKLIDTNGKKITNTSMRAYHKEDSDIYKQLEEIIESVEWEPLDTDKIYNRFSNDDTFMQSYTNFMKKIK